MISIPEGHHLHRVRLVLTSCSTPSRRKLVTDLSADYTREHPALAPKYSGLCGAIENIDTRHVSLLGDHSVSMRILHTYPSF